MRYLVTGGTGYVGSHVVAALYKAGHSCVVLDSLENSSYSTLRRLEALCKKRIPFLHHSITYGIPPSVGPIDGVFHLAGLKSVAESAALEERYRFVNVEGTAAVVDYAYSYGVPVVFSSSATVYAESADPLNEDSPLHPISVYGETKLAAERILQEYGNAVILRYFNPVGAHPSLLIGESPVSTPTNLVPLLIRAAAAGQTLSLFGSDYPTPDGSCIRDYVDVNDLADGHLMAVSYAHSHKGYSVFNLGTGAGTSVIQLVGTFNSATGNKVALRPCSRRPGDQAIAVASVEKAFRVLGWAPSSTLHQSMKSAWDFWKGNETRS